MSPSERSWLKEYLDAEFKGITLQLQSLIDYNETEKKEKLERIKNCNERFVVLETAVKCKKKILTPEGAGMGRKLWNKLLEDVTNSRVYRYSFIILVLGIGFGLARKTGVFELGFIKEILAYILGLKVQ